MKNTKKILCLVLAVAIMVTTMGLVTAIADEGGSGEGGSTSVTSETSTTVASKDEDYIFKFKSDMGLKLLSCDELTGLMGRTVGDNSEYVEESTVDGAGYSVNADGSIKITRDIEQRGTNIEIPVTDEMRENFKKATDNTAIVSLWLSNCKDAKDIFKNSQFRIYTRYKTSFKDTSVKDKEFDSYIKSITSGYLYLDCYQQIINKKIQFSDPVKTFNKLDDKGEIVYESDGTTPKKVPAPLESLDDVESIIISLYDYNKTTAELNLSGFAYAGSPAVKAFIAPSAADKNSSTPIMQWSKSYDRQWNNPPDTLKYSADFGTDAKKYSALLRGSTYFRVINEVVSKEVTVYYFLDRDEFNKGIVTANQEGGSHQAQISINVKNILDTSEKEMMAEFQFSFFDYNGKSYIPVQNWVKTGDTKTFTFDTSEIDVNSIQYAKLCVMNYWRYCEADGKYYDYDKRVEEKDDKGEVVKTLCTDSDGNKNVDITGKELTIRKMGSFEVFISSVNTVPASGLKTTTAAGGNSTTKGGSDEYKYAGYHAFDFAQESHDESYGNNPTFIDFMGPTSAKRYSLDNHTYSDECNGFSGKEIDYSKDKNYLADFEEASKLGSGGYQVETQSPYPNVKQQHQVHFWISGKREDEERTKKTGDHEPLKPQNEKYDYTTQLANGIKYANANPDGNVQGFLAIDVYAMSCVHGYKNIYNKTYEAWCKKNGKPYVNETCSVQVVATIFGTKDDIDVTVNTMTWVGIGEKKTLTLDVSELEGATINGVRIASQNYSNLANKEQGGNNDVCGVTDVTTRYSAIYVPGKNSGIKTTVVKTAPLNLKEAKQIKKLYDALPGFTVDDYNSMADYEKLAAFMKAYDNSSAETKKYVAKNYGIDQDKYIQLVLLMQDVVEKMDGGGFVDGDDDNPYGTGDVAFPLVSVLVAACAGYVIIRTRKRKS